MSHTTGKSRVGLESWYAPSLRLTTFHRAGAVSIAEGQWKAVVGEEPEGSIAKPKTGERAEVGPFGAARLTLSLKSREGRIDWTLSDADPFEEVETPTLVSRLKVFENLMRRWLNDPAPEMTRIAVGGIAALPTTSLEEGYLTLSKYLEFDFKPANSSDFLFQINRPRPSASIPGFSVNRLTKWSVSKSFLGTMTISPSDEKPFAVENEGPTQSYCQVELDINTVPEADKPLPRDKVALQFDELVELFTEIVREGDV